MKRRVLIIINQTALPGEKSYTRTLSLYKLLEESGHDVRIVTSRFNHYDKKIRDVEIFNRTYPEWKVSFIEEPGYEKNVSIKRIHSQRIFARHLFSWFKKNINDYDVVYMTMPTNEGAELVGAYCNKKHIPYIIDVRDLWPDAMKMFFKSEKLFRLLTYPMKKTADKAYAQADGIVAVSRDYLNRALKSNSRSEKNAVVYQGAYLKKFDTSKDANASMFHKPQEEFWIAYIGTLGESYDINTFIDAIHYLHQQGYKQIKAKILGRGPSEEEFKNHTKKIGAEIDFVGFMPYEQMAGFLSNCDAMINAIKKNAAQSIINKISDYFASGKPTLNGNTHPEMLALIDDYNAGINYEPENYKSLSEAILKLYKNPELCKEMGQNGRKLAEEKFDREVSYQEIIKMIDDIQSK